MSVNNASYFKIWDPEYFKLDTKRLSSMDFSISIELNIRATGRFVYLGIAWSTFAKSQWSFIFIKEGKKRLSTISIEYWGHHLKIVKGGDRPLNRPQRELIERVQEVKSDKIVLSLLSDKWKVLAVLAFTLEKWKVKIFFKVKVNWKLDQVNSANLLLMFWCLDNIFLWRRGKTEEN